MLLLLLYFCQIHLPTHKRGLLLTHLSHQIFPLFPFRRLRSPEHAVSGAPLPGYAWPSSLPRSWLPLEHRTGLTETRTLIVDAFWVMLTTTLEDFDTPPFFVYIKGFHLHKDQRDPSYLLWLALAGTPEDQGKQVNRRTSDGLLRLSRCTCLRGGDDDEDPLNWRETSSAEPEGGPKPSNGGPCRAVILWPVCKELGYSGATHMSEWFP